MDQREPTKREEDNGSLRRYALGGAIAVLVFALFAGGIFLLLSGDADPPKRVQEITVVTIVPPPPPPPPPPQQQPPPEPPKQEIVEEKPVETPKEIPQEAKDDEPPPGPLSLADQGQGPGDQFGLGGKPGGRGLLGGGAAHGGSRWGWYANIVQSQIEAALRTNEKTRHALMQVQVRLWSDGTGRVNRVQLMSSTGNAELDAVIRDEVLAGLTLREPPPKDMPMPIITRITARKAS